MKPRYWSLAIVLILINYLIFATLFSMLIENNFGTGHATRTPIPTFTPAPAEPIIIVPTPEPVTPEPTATATRVLAPESGNSSAGDVIQANSRQANPEPAARPELESPGTVNIRAGPGLNYSVIGALNPNTPMPITGRNADASWWQIRVTSGAIGWVANSVVRAKNTKDVAIVAAPPPPQPQPEPEVSNVNDAPPPPPKPAYQYEPTGWFDDGNAGLTRFLGDIKDVNGNPVNGVFVRATCGDFSVISNPSGPVGWGRWNESSDWPAGFYDLTVDTRPVPCIWTLSVVDTDDKKRVRAVLSEEIPIEITMEKSIVTANWRKNW